MASPSRIYDAEVTRLIRQKIDEAVNALGVELSFASRERIQKRFYLAQGLAKVEGNSISYDWENAVREEIEWLKAYPNDRGISFNTGQDNYYDLTRGK